MKHFDVVIIGSGLGGLVCGYILSKNGYKVGIFEKNNVFGGCLQTFRRNGVRFDTGMHYIGSLNEGQILFSLFRYLNLLEDVKFKKLDEDGYDRIYFRDRLFSLAMGHERFSDTLSKDFHAERKEIETYVKRIKNIAEASYLNYFNETDPESLNENYSIKTSVNSFINGITSNEKLRNILAGSNSLYAGVVDKTPLSIHAKINNSFIESAWRIVGGSETITSSLLNLIRKSGGEVFNNSGVRKIHTSNDSVTSVELNNGEIVNGNRFISNVHPQSTLEILDTPLIRKAYRDRINSIENTISTFALYIIFKPGTVRYMNYNYYHHNTHDVWSCHNYNESDWPRGYMYMHQVDTPHMEFATSAKVMAYMRFSDVMKWKDTETGRRGNDYLAFKKEKAERLISELNNAFPGIKNNIDKYYTSSPLTYRDYTSTPAGSTYGIIKDCNNPINTLIHSRTKIPNLFFTGQNINMHGFLGVTMGAIITSAEILGMKKIIREIIC
jgi:all-trans-retinol 13,14-reductase